MVKEDAMKYLGRALTAACVVTALAASAAAQAPPVYTLDEVTAPRVVKEVKPHYTPAAMEAGIQGVVVLDVVVQKDGTVGDVNITRSLDTVHGLDEEAVRAVKQWRFRPGRKDGEAVAVLVEIELTFTLRK